MDKNYYKEYYHLERSHWWFQARLRILRNIVKKYANGRPLNILNVGVATGLTSEMLSQFGQVTSVEYDEDCCNFLRQELKMDVLQASLTDLPFESKSYDLVCAFDVIEHIEYDSKAIAEIKRVLSKNGHYIITVPAFQFLWSDHDEINHHFRRYTRKSLFDKLSENQLSISYLSYFNFWLFPPIAFVRILKKAFTKTRPKEEIKSDFSIMKNLNLVDSILFNIFLSENSLISRNIRLPFGLSLIAWGNEKSTKDVI